MQSFHYQKDSHAWLLQTWASFLVSISATTLSLVYLPIDGLLKSQLAVCFLYSISSTFTLAKSVRDQHEANKIFSRIDEAKVEKILSTHHPLQ